VGYNYRVTYSSWSEYKNYWGQTRRGKYVPVIPPLAPGEPDFDHDPVVAICGECNKEIRRMEFYYCMNNRCPVQHAVYC
jgi:hypothetical protein